MKKAFLIDFENVKSAGLVGLEQLSAADEVVVLYSANSNTISFEMHQKILQSPACVDYYQIRRGGKNSLDFQLSSLLGYLLGTGAYSHLYVVSNDAGFDVLRDFWTSDFVPNDCVVYRRSNLAACLAHARLLEEGRQAETVQPKPEAASEQPAPQPQPEEQPAEPAGAEEEPVQPVEAEPAVQEQPDQPAQPEESQPERRAERQSRGRRKNQKQQPGQPQSQPQAQPASAQGDASRALLEQALPAAFVALADENTRRQVTELLLDTEGKQDFYRRMIADYGQKKGLEIYKTIKSEYTNLKKLLEKSGN